MLETILPNTAQTILSSINVTFVYLALHHYTWNHRESLKMIAFYKPRECLVKGTRVRKWGMKEML